MPNYLPRPVLGVAYYPEQWPEERWQTDAEQMKELGLRVVRLAEFSWGRLETAPYEQSFDWLDRVIKVLDSQGLKVILGTPSAAPPPWLVEQDRGILAVDREGRRLSAGGRHFYCPSNSNYRSECNRLAREMAQHYLNNYAVIGWQVDNELGNHGNARCYCGVCASRWQNWLRDQYETLERLNQEWGTVFWGQEFTDWYQIPLPTGTGGGYNPSLELEFRRFSSRNAIEFFNLQVDAIRESWSTRRGFITHNLFFGDDNVNFYDLAFSLDFISWDNYPHGMKAASDIAFYHDLMWGVKNNSYWVMEQALGNVNWTKYNPPVYPGQVRLWTIQNFLRGCQGTVYFSWRQSRFGSEQYHSAFIGHDGYRRKPFNEVMELVKELDRLPQNFFRRQKAQVALLYSFEDLWALQLQPHNAHFDYPQLVREMHASLYKQHTPVDVLPKDTALAVLKEYKLVIALAPVLGDEYIAGIWREYVEQGGKLLLVTRAGEKEITNIWTSEAQPHSMHNWVGVRVDEQISFPPYLPGQYQNLLIGDTPASKDTPLLLFDEITGRQVQARRLWLESLEPYEGTEVILRYGFGTEGDFFLFMNSVAFTCNKVQQGEVYYLGALPNEDTYRYLWEEVFREECVPVAPELPRENGLEIVRAGIAGEYLVLLNHSSHALEFSLGKRYRTMDGAEVERANMPPFSVLFLAEIS